MYTYIYAQSLSIIIIEDFIGVYIQLNVWKWNLI